MKCLEGYTIEQVKQMSYKELLVLGETIAKEVHETELRNKIVGMIDVMQAKANGSLIEN